MREIKFRAWNTDGKHMIDLLKITPLALDPALEQSGLFLPFSTSIFLMQFTSLTDKDGQEIYEGNIVESLDWNPSRYQVGFNRGAFCFFNEGDVFYNDAKYLESGFAVIGNIYENPELLQ